MALLPRVLMIVAVAMPLLSAACGPAKKPQPTVDPVKEQITILQKQLLELQNHQNETRRLVDEQGVRLKDLEEQRVPPPPVVPPVSVSSTAPKAAVKTAPAKKPVTKRPLKKKKKKRPARRQVP